jgi:hypothetical protein
MDDKKPRRDKKKEITNGKIYNANCMFTRTLLNTSYEQKMPTG